MGGHGQAMPLCFLKASPTLMAVLVYECGGDQLEVQLDGKAALFTKWSQVPVLQGTP